MDRVDVVVIGAGVVGLSVAAHVARQDRSLLLVERHGSFGQEASSRNSEVIHASIYYPPDSLKGRLCLEGNERMYDLCSRHGILHVNCGKLIVAWTAQQLEDLPSLLATAEGNGARGVRIVDRDEIRRLEPKVHALAALHCPSSGIVDSHALMRHFFAQARDRGADLLFGPEVVGLEKRAGSTIVTVREKDGAASSIEARVVVNCAGLGSGKVAALAGIDPEAHHYRIHYRKGSYFRVVRGVSRLPAMLIYPVPSEDATVGIHTVPDLAGGMRLGPYDTWEETENYDVDPCLLDHFFEAASPFLPGLHREDLQADMAGIQAKRYGPGEPSRDFVIREESDKGLSGLINLIGIESPGLTASPAIGPFVARMVDEILR